MNDGIWQGKRNDTASPVRRAMVRRWSQSKIVCIAFPIEGMRVPFLSRSGVTD